jgi:hypothetical protein
MTSLFFLEMSQLFYETFNSRQVLRQLAAMYSATALAAALGMEYRGTSPNSWAWQVAALPRNPSIRAALLRGLTSIVQARVSVMQRRQIIFNSKGIRCDGNWDLAKIMTVGPDGEAFSVVLGFCGLDGSLLVPLIPVTAENWAEIDKVLEPILVEIRDVMLESGFSLQDTLPVFHSTDTFGKHRLKLRGLYDRVWQALRVQSSAPTPRAASTGRRVVPPGQRGRHPGHRGSEARCYQAPSPCESEMLRPLRLSPRPRRHHQSLVGTRAPNGTIESRRTPRGSHGAL